MKSECGCAGAGLAAIDGAAAARRVIAVRAAPTQARRGAGVMPEWAMRPGRLPGQ